MASGTASELEGVEVPECVADESATVSRSKEKIRTESTDMDSRESAVWLYFEKMDQVGTGYHVANCKGCGKVVKVLKGNTTNFMSHLRIKHPKIHKEKSKKNR